MEMQVYECISPQNKAFGLRQFSNQQAMNIKSVKITRKRATGGHLVNRWLRRAACLLTYQRHKNGARFQRRNYNFNSDNVVLFAHWKEKHLHFTQHPEEEITQAAS